MEVFATVITILVLGTVLGYLLTIIIGYMIERKMSKYWYHPKQDKMILRCKYCSSNNSRQICDYDCGECKEELVTDKCPNEDNRK